MSVIKHNIPDDVLEIHQIATGTPIDPCGCFCRKSWHDDDNPKCDYHGNLDFSGSNECERLELAYELVCTHSLFLRGLYDYEDGETYSNAEVLQAYHEAAEEHHNIIHLTTIKPTKR